MRVGVARREPAVSYGAGVVAPPFLAVDRYAARRLGGSLEQQRTRPAGRVVDSLILTSVRADTDHLGEDAGDLGRRVELALALARLGGEVAHQVLVGIAEQVVTFSA